MRTDHHIANRVMAGGALALVGLSLVMEKVSVAAEISSKALLDAADGLWDVIVTREKKARKL